MDLKNLDIEKVAQAIEKDAGQPLEGLRTSLAQAKEGLGRVVHSPLLATRKAAGFTQAELAKLMGVSVRTLQEWEQGRRSPSGAAKTLWRVAETHPDVLRELVSA